MDNVKMKAPWWFWVIGVLYLLWNLVGCSMYLTEQFMGDAAYGEMFGAEMLAVRDFVPAWATAGYAIGVWGGLVGIILFLLRKRLCLPFFYASFIGAVIGHLPSLLDTRFSELLGFGDYILMAIIFTECLLIIWIARKMRARGVLT